MIARAAAADTRGMWRRAPGVLLIASSLFLNGCAAHTPPRVIVAPAPRLEAHPLPADLPDWISAGVLDAARGLLGVPYRNGGTSPLGFDCSGFVQFVYSQAGLFVARDVRHQFAAGMLVDSDSARPGDLIFFTTSSPGSRGGRAPSHVGIVLDEQTFIHAPSSQGVVRVEPIGGRYWRERYVGVRRMVPTEQVLSTRN